MNLAGSRVLVLEDEPIIALAAEDLLLELGAVPVLVDQLADGERRRAERSIDAAILDVNLHGHRSYPLAIAMRADGLPFIFATGYGAGGLPDALAGVPVLTKPYKLSDVRDAFAALAPRPRTD
jgi:CheY-like chemotaxis protein